jgi:hypothetical protein
MAGVGAPWASHGELTGEGEEGEGGGGEGAQLGGGMGLAMGMQEGGVCCGSVRAASLAAVREKK